LGKRQLPMLLRYFISSGNFSHYEVPTLRTRNAFTSFRYEGKKLSYNLKLLVLIELEI